MILGFEELALRCSGSSAKQYVLEAMKSYEASAYRAAIVSAYVAICFDLIEKLRLLSAAGDAAATKEVEHLTNLQRQHEGNDPQAIPGLLAFERNLLELFRDKFEFFGVDEFEQLSRLRFDRNRCAHPSFTRSEEPFSPSAELARMHIRNSVEYVLSQPPRQGKAALAGLEATVLSQYFPTEPSEIAIRMKASGLDNSRPSLMRAFIDELTFGYAKPGHGYHKKSFIPFVVKAAIEIDRPIALPRAVKNAQKLLASTDADAIRIGAGLILTLAEVADGVDQATRVTMTRWLGTNQESTIVTIVRRALRIAWLRPEAEKVIQNLTREQIGRASGKIPAEVLSRAALLYAKSSNWDTANSFATKVAVPQAAKFSEADLDLIFDHVNKGLGDLRSSHGFHDFVEALYDNHPLGEVGVSALLDKHELQDFKR
ncbi:hypothetical protein [Rhizobium fabae]|uniref:Uncharacterized protein n=1 Tax=Rhizobium fabae TaxID=573179 RepID=A0A7W6BAN8_9HYPH|nr:hypothetical protein [Rhizobium fabae]MBB3917053.1 hypothetical protein [Rhizobium fabae]RUM10570.1 hypothetical protein EFB14_22800 [Rhizobium fabae]